MQTMNPIPPDMNIHALWARHDIVTDEMVAWFKKSIGCETYHGVMEVTRERFSGSFRKQVPEGKVAWLKKDRRNGAFNKFEDNMVFTDPNGSNPMVVKNFGGDCEEMELMPLE
jgi:hypothetical protein